MRLNVNLQAMTLEKLDQKMQRSNLGVIDMLIDNMRFAGIPDELVSPLRRLKIKMEAYPYSQFNDAEFFRKATDQALNALQ